MFIRFAKMEKLKSVLTECSAHRRLEKNKTLREDKEEKLPLKSRGILMACMFMSFCSFLLDV